MKTKQEIVILFCEDNQPVGMLLQNGEAHFFKVSKANKEFVSNLLETDKIEE